MDCNATQISRRTRRRVTKRKKPIVSTEPKPASIFVTEALEKFAETLPWDNTADFEDAARGHLGALPDAIYENKVGTKAWSVMRHAFVEGSESPDSVNPSLWRQARLNKLHGLFEVVPGVYQIRGMDLANMTIVEGQKGIIVIDTLSTQEGAAAALALYRRHREDRPVTGVILTHTHADHWGGVLGVATAEDFASGNVPLIAPDRFMEYAVSENILVGNAMRRRGLYQFGIALPPGPKGQVDNGLGLTFARGASQLAQPNDLITQTGDTRQIDGVTFEFQMAPDTEAPAEMHMFLPDFGVLNMAENAVHNFHNLLPFRGAQVRNASNWTRYISEALELWGDRAEVLIGQHHWPTFGQSALRQYLEVQRDLYKFVHDQTVRLINRGLTPHEIAEELHLPDTLEQHWHIRGYYGALKHNVKAIYQFYMGWYDCVPAHLDPLPPTQTGQKMIEYMGGIDAAVSRAQADFEAGNYRWVAQVMNHAVFSDPNHQGARALLADAYEQMGYLAECATWRNSYLFGAFELRNGPKKMRGATANRAGALAALSGHDLFDLMGTWIDPDRAAGLSFSLIFAFSDHKERHLLTLQNCALTHVPAKDAATADLTVQLARADFNRLLTRQASFADLSSEGKVKADGDLSVLKQLMSSFADPAGDFAIVEP